MTGCRLDAARPLAQRWADGASQTFGFLLLPEFPLLSLSSAVETLYTANQIAGQPLYDWWLLSLDGKAVPAASGMTIRPDGGLEAISCMSDLIVVAGHGSEHLVDHRLRAWLRKLSRQGCRLGALSMGSSVLARAGLLRGFRCTIHWQALDGFRESFPAAEVTSHLFESDGPRFTCAGGVAALDLMLWMIAHRHGWSLATQVSEQLVHGRVRGAQDQQRMSLRLRLGVHHPKVLGTVALMEGNLEEPLSRAELARRMRLSMRQLERLFRKYLNRSPGQYYLELRLYRARTLLLQTSLSIAEVAMACGFASLSHFTKCYRGSFSIRPSDERRAHRPNQLSYSTTSIRDSEQP